MRVEQLLSDSAGRLGHKAAIVAGRMCHSFADLERKSDRLAAAMSGRGVKRGDRVAAFLDNSFAAVVTTFAVLKAGAVLCPFDSATEAETLASFLEQSRAVGIVTEARLASVAGAAIAQTPAVKLVVLVGGDRAAAQGSCLSFEDVVERIGAVDVKPGGRPEDPAILLHVTATDGAPQSETYTHSDLVAAASVSGTREDALVVAALPISSHYGLYQLLTAIRAGATQILESPFLARPSMRGRRADETGAGLALAS